MEASVVRHSLLPAPLLPRARQGGVAEGLQGRGESGSGSGSGGGPGRARARRAGSPGCAGEREDGAAWLPASVCCAVSPALLPHGRHFRVLSAVAAPCGAVPSRPARAIFLCLVWEAFLSWALGAAPRNPKSLASLPYPTLLS